MYCAYFCVGDQDDKLYVDPMRYEGDFFINCNTAMSNKHRYFTDKKKAESSLYMYMILTCSCDKSCKQFLQMCYVKAQTKRSVNVKKQKLPKDGPDNYNIKLLDCNKKLYAVIFRLSNTVGQFIHVMTLVRTMVTKQNPFLQSVG